MPASSCGRQRQLLAVQPPDALLLCLLSALAVEVGEKLVICLASTLNLDGTPSSATFDAVRGRALLWWAGWRRHDGQQLRSEGTGSRALAWCSRDLVRQVLVTSQVVPCAKPPSPFPHLPNWLPSRPQSFASGRRTLMDNFEYVMHGKVFKFKDNSSSGQLKADVSDGVESWLSMHAA